MMLNCTFLLLTSNLNCPWKKKDFKVHVTGLNKIWKFSYIFFLIFIEIIKNSIILYQNGLDLAHCWLLLCRKLCIFIYIYCIFICADFICNFKFYKLRNRLCFITMAMMWQQGRGGAVEESGMWPQPSTRSQGHNLLLFWSYHGY